VVRTSPFGESTTLGSCSVTCYGNELSQLSGAKLIADQSDFSAGLHGAERLRTYIACGGDVFTNPCGL
jgi:hypothetical protein